MAFDLAEFLDRCWFAIGTEQSEAEKKLYRDELVAIADDVFYDVAVEVADTPMLSGMLETIWLYPIVPGFGAVSLLDDGAGRTDASGNPSTVNPLVSRIRKVYHIAAGGTRTYAHRLVTPDGLDWPQPPGLIWWALRDTVIDTIDTGGRTRYTGNALDGMLEIHAPFLPNIAHFPNRMELQPILVKHMVRKAREKRDDRLAAAMLKAEAA